MRRDPCPPLFEAGKLDQFVTARQPADGQRCFASGQGGLRRPLDKRFQLLAVIAFPPGSARIGPIDRPRQSALNAQNPEWWRSVWRALPVELALAGREPLFKVTHSIPLILSSIAWSLVSTSR